MLACNPEKQEILFEEISKICPDINKHITRDQIEHMVYLKAIIKESLRMLPNAIDITRITQKDLVICGYKINKGVSAMQLLSLDDILYNYFYIFYNNACMIVDSIFMCIY